MKLSIQCIFSFTYLIYGIYCQNECTDDNGKTGKCVIIANCPNISSSVSIQKLLSIACGRDSDNNVKICCVPQSENACGLSTQDYESPWVVGLGKKSGSKVSISCSGVLITDRHVLGSHDCVDHFNTGRLTHAILGTNSVQDTNKTIAIIQSAQGFPGFSLNEAYMNNIAIYKLANPINFSKKIKPICLPKTETNTENLVVSKWEVPKSTKVQSGYTTTVAANYIHLSTCRDFSSYKNLNLNERSVCSYYARYCDQYELQSILIQKNPETGVHSVNGVGPIGPTCENARGIPEVYTNVFSYLDWIQTQIK